MNDCLPHQLLLDFLSGRLSADEARGIAAHLDECAACRQLADSLAGTPALREFHRCYAERPAVECGVEEQETQAGPLPGALSSSTPANRTSRPSTGDAVTELATAKLVFGRFRVRRSLGAGGFGRVYLAEDTQLGRDVALKIPRSGTLTDPEARERFMREVRAAAGLHHPQIVAVFDAGQSDGEYFMASAYCPGPTLSGWLRDRETPADPDEAARIVLALAEAAQHAHERGVVHRDIKPQNVLLDPTTGYRELPYCPKLTDFSIAKLLDDGGEETASHILVGTPRYMAPEQASGRRDLLGPCCDIYALGVVLYELLTGESPVQGNDNADTLRRVLTDEPLAPRKRRANIPRDLEAICLTCLRKAPQQRYPSARALADDLERYSSGKPTLARPMSATELGLRWLRQHPAAASVAGATIALTLFVIGGLLLYNSRLNEFNASLGQANTDLSGALQRSQLAEVQATASERRVQRLLYVADMRLANRARLDGDLRTLAQLLQRHEPLDGRPDERGLEWWFLKSLAEVPPVAEIPYPDTLYYLKASPDQRRIAAAGKDAIVRLYDSDSGRLLQSLDSQQREVNSVAFSADGRRIATAGDDGTACIWDLDSGARLVRIAAHPELVYGVAFVLDDTVVASGGNEPVVRLWDVRTGQPRGELPGHEKGIEALAPAPDGQGLAVAGRDGRVRLWQLAELREQFVVKNRLWGFAYSAIAFTPNGSWLVASDIDTGIWIWDARSGRLLARGKHLDAVHAMAVSPDGQHLVSGDAAGTLCLWDVSPVGSSPDPASDPMDNDDAPELLLVRRWSGHAGRINGLTFDHEGRPVSGGTDGQIRVWNLASVAQPLAARIPESHLSTPSFTRNADLVALTNQGTLLAWQLGSAGTPRDGRSLSDDLIAIGLNHRGTGWATISRAGAVAIWRAAPRARERANWNGPTSDLPQQPDPSSAPVGEAVGSWNIGADRDPRDLSLTNDERRLAILVRTPERAVLIYDVATQRLESTLRLLRGTVNHVQFSPDGRQVAVNIDNDVLIWRVESGATIDSSDTSGSVERITATHANLVNLTFGPRDGWLATCGSDRLIKLWDARTGQLVSRLTGHRGTVNALCFAPDGRTLFSAGADGTVKAWNLESFEELLDVYRHDHLGIEEIAISPDGRYLAATTSFYRQIVLIGLRAAHGD